MASRAARHAAEPKPDPGSDRSLATRVLVGLLAGVLVFGLLVVGAVAVLSQVGGKKSDKTASAPRPTCAAHTLRVAVDPAIADAVLAATADLSDFVGESSCLAVDVDAQDSSTVASTLSRPLGVGLATSLPDAWLPDSSVWLNVARRTETGQRRLDQTSISVASSPVVLAVQSDKAAAAGWPGTQPTWSSLLAAPTAEWRLGTQDPQTSATGLGALLGLPPKSTEFASLGRRLELPSTTDRSPAAIVAAGDLDAMPTAEYDVARIADGGGNVVAAYDPALGGALDFPLIGISPDGEPVSEQVAADLDILRKALQSTQLQEVLTGAGLRGPDGALDGKYVGEGGAPALGVLANQTVQPVTATTKQVTKAQATWSLVGRRSRLLVLLDVSGSMEQTLPGGQTSKIELAKQSLKQLVDASAPDSDLGLWTFTTGTNPDGTDRVVDVGPLGGDLAGQTRRERLSSVVTGLAAQPDGGTPLYRAVLAAYASALDDYSFGRYNAVVVVTDGRDEDDTQTPIPSAKMLDQLRRTYDGMRPLEIISLAYGEGADFAVLKKMADVTGGASYQGLTQEQVTKMLTDALSSRT